MLEKNFTPKDVEQKSYQEWEGAGGFKADVNSNKQPYTIPMPPPNVTGSLHMGHALTMTLQDILTRFQRLQDKDVLWMPGTDHAGIATQMVVERQLSEKGISRHELGREKFLETVWQWKEQSGSTITTQLRRLGASPDWQRERFTMDDGLSRAVLKVFVQLFNEGLIYKDKRLVNWDPKLHTAVSDLEVEQIEINGNMWYFRYPVEGDTERFITIATTRPETMLGDAAIAVHPDDARYKDLIGKFAILPIVGRPIPIIADEYADPEKGSGAVKITPAHDFNDFEVGKRHNLPMISVFDKDAKINENAPEEFQGLDRFDARKKIVAEMEALELIEKVEPQVHAVPHDEKSKSVILEPFLTDQWYCDAKTLAAPAIKAVEDGRTEFVPATWTKTYYDWMRNIQPWCISRQLWWGHRIPAWYGPDEHVFVAETEEDAHAQAEKHYGAKTDLVRDPDVLDTWFSSALWPFSTLGWPDDAAEVKRYYPADTLITGFDIIFFWVARMMMMGIHFMGDVPFRKVYIHALVRDEKGQKMSKTKGNVVDPLDVIDQFGADALRFTMAALAAQGRDVKWSNARAEGYRNFTTKLWNAARYCEMNECKLDAAFKPASAQHRLNRWILTETAGFAEQVKQSLDEFKYNEAANTIYHFVWGTFCDWYLEFTKPLLQAGDEAVIAETRATTAYVLSTILQVLNPFMPYITEELNKNLTGGNEWLQNGRWPTFDGFSRDADALAEMDWVVRLIQSVRSVRADMNVPVAAQIIMQLKDASSVTRARLETHGDIIKRMARLSEIGFIDGAVGKGAIQCVLDEATIVLPIADVIDIEQERKRLQKEAAKVSGDIEKIAQKLSSPAFVERAPPEIVEEQQSRKRDAESVLSKLQQALKQLEGTA